MTLKTHVAFVLLLFGGLSGCSLIPQQTAEERTRLEEAGAAYQVPAEKRVLPELPSQPTWREVLQRAFLANGELEAAYHEWAAAVNRIDKEASWPNANLELGFDYMFSDEAMKSWNRTTLSAGFVNDGLTLPFKTRQAGKVALAEARAAAEKFRARKFDVQKRVLQGWVDFALGAERVRIQQENVDLLTLVVETARGRVRAGGAQQDLLKADVELERAEDELKNMEAEVHHMQVMLNAMLGREANAPLLPPKAIPPPREIVADDASLIREAVAQNPELAELARTVEGRKDAVELARLMYIPDLSPVAAITGDVSQAVGAMVMVPTNIVAIQSEVRQMRSMVAATESMLRQTRLDRTAAFVAALVAVRNYERQSALFQNRIVPASRQVMDLTRQSYATGGTEFLDLIDSQRVLLEARLALSEARAGREKQLAELEALAGLDVESLGKEAGETSNGTPDATANH